MSGISLLQYHYRHPSEFPHRSPLRESKHCSNLRLYQSMSHHGVGADGLNLVHETRIEGALRDIRRLADTITSPLPWEQRLQLARTAIATFESTGFIQMSNRSADRTFVVTELQRFAYCDADGAGVTVIAEWCMNQWLSLLQINNEDLTALRG